MVGIVSAWASGVCVSSFARDGDERGRECVGGIYESFSCSFVFLFKKGGRGEGNLIFMSAFRTLIMGVRVACCSAVPCVCVRCWEGKRLRARGLLNAGRLESSTVDSGVDSETRLQHTYIRRMGQLFFVLVRLHAFSLFFSILFFLFFLFFKSGCFFVCLCVQFNRACCCARL